MGIVYADIELLNVADECLCDDGYLAASEVRSLSVKIMADSGAIRLVINEKTRLHLGLKIRSKYPAVLADGTCKVFDLAGPVRVKFGERYSITHAVVLPGEEEMLLGTLPMEEMDLVIIPSSQTLAYNPKYPSWTLSMRSLKEIKNHPVCPPLHKNQPAYV